MKLTRLTKIKNSDASIARKTFFPKVLCQKEYCLTDTLKSIKFFGKIKKF